MRDHDKTATERTRTSRNLRLAILLLLISTLAIAFGVRMIHGLRKSEAALDADLRSSNSTIARMVEQRNRFEKRIEHAEEDLALEIESCDEDTVDLKSGYLETVNIFERQLVSCNGENHKACARIGLCRWRLRLTEQDVITLRREDDAEIYGEKNLATDEWLHVDERMRLNEN